MLCPPSDPLATLDHDRLKHFLECLSLCAFAIDVLPDGCFRCAAANSHFEDVAGGGPPIVGRQPLDLFPGPAGVELEAYCQRCVDARQRIDWHLTLAAEEGDLCWKVDLVPQADRTGHVVRLIATATDVTALRELEASRAFSQVRLETILERQDEALALWDANDRLVLCNRRYQDFFPTARHRLQPGLTRAEIAPHDLLTLDPHADTDDQRTGIERWLGDGRCVQTEQRPVAGGELLELRRDITYRKRTERAVNQSRTILRAMLNAIDEMIAMINSDGVVLAINRFGALWLGEEPDRLVGRSLAAILDEPCAGMLGQLADRVLATGERQDAELSWRARILDVSLNPVLGEDGIPTAVSLVARDITEKRLDEERSRDHQQTLARCMRIASMGEMAAAIAHELSQPIAAASTFCHASLARLGDGDRLSAEDADALAEVCREIDRAASILNNMTGFVRRSPVERSPVQINDLVRAAADLTAKDLERRGVTVVLDLADGLPPISANAVEIEQVVLNLIRNGMEALSEATQPTLNVITRRSSGGIDICVVDNGRGISAEHRANLFKPFFSTKSGGLGMGLAICRTIVEAHGGQIEATPAPVEGASVRFTLPVKDAGRDGR